MASNGIAVIPAVVGALSSVYTIQDIEDDTRLGLKSTAIYFGENAKPWISLFGVGMGSLLALTGYNYGAGPIFYVGASAAMMHIAYQV